MEKSIYPIYPRNYLLWDRIGFCTSKMDDEVETILTLPTDQSSATVGFVGIPTSIACMENEDILAVYRSLTFISIDGMPIVKKARKAGIDCERCSGPDMMALLLKESVKRGMSHYFYGGKDDEVLKKIRNNLERDYPGIKITGMYSPPFRNLTEEEDAELCRSINEIHPDFIWVGIGAPRQDIWMAEHKDKIKGAIMLGVGAAFDFVAGSLDRAPESIQKAGFEWLYRYVKEPGRLWKRYVYGGLKYVYYNIKYPSRQI